MARARAGDNECLFPGQRRFADTWQIEMSKMPMAKLAECAGGVESATTTRSLQEYSRFAAPSAHGRLLWLHNCHPVQDYRAATLFGYLGTAWADAGDDLPASSASKSRFSSIHSLIHSFMHRPSARAATSIQDSVAASVLMSRMLRGCGNNAFAGRVLQLHDATRGRMATRPPLGSTATGSAAEKQACDCALGADGDGCDQGDG